MLYKYTWDSKTSGIQGMNNLIVIMSGKLTGTIRWDIRKSTKMTVDRYLDMLVKLLANKVEGELQFAPLPPSLDLYGGLWTG